MTPQIIINMNEIIKIKSDGLPNISIPQLPLLEGMKSYPPEFWLETSTEKQYGMIEELKKNSLEYKVYEVVDSVPLKFIVVCRSCLPYSETQRIIMDICNKLLVDEFVVSDGSLASVSVNEDLQGFITVD